LASNLPSTPDARLKLAGTLRRRRAGYALEEPIDHSALDDTRWTTPRVYLVEAPADLMADADMCVNRIVTISGRPNRRGRRHNTVIVLDAVTPVEPTGPAI